MLGSLLSVSSPLREVLLLPQFAASVLKQTHDSTKSVRREGDRPSGGVAKREPHGVHAASPSSLHRGGSARERRPPAAAASCVAACVTGTLRRSPREGASVRTTSSIRHSPASHGAPATCPDDVRCKFTGACSFAAARPLREASAYCSRHLWQGWTPPDDCTGVVGTCAAAVGADFDESVADSLNLEYC